MESSTTRQFTTEINGSPNISSTRRTGSDGYTSTFHAINGLDYNHSTPSAKMAEVRPINSYMKNFSSAFDGYSAHGSSGSLAEYGSMVGTATTSGVSASSGSGSEAVGYTSIKLSTSYSPNKFSDIETMTIQKQRRELQLLISELKDRDRAFSERRRLDSRKELNEMVTSHQKQLITWESDHQKALILEKQITKLKVEIKKRNELVKELKTSLHNHESAMKSHKDELDSTKVQLWQSSQKITNSSQCIQDMQERNDYLATSVQDFSTTIGQLQARELELTTALKLKDGDIDDANNRIAEMTRRVRNIHSLKQEQKRRETQLINERDQWKEQYVASQQEAEKLKVELNRKLTSTDEHFTELSQIKQDYLLLQKELFLAGEREKRKDQLLELHKSKQERTETELHHLRQLYERQQREVVFIQQQLPLNDTFDLSERLSQGIKSNEVSPSLPSMESRESLFSQNTWDGGLIHNGDSISDVVTVAGTKTEVRTSVDYVDKRSHMTSVFKSRGVDADTTYPLSQLTLEERCNNQTTTSTDTIANSSQSRMLLTQSDLMTTSPTSRLHKLLTESRQMVQTLEDISPYHSYESDACKDITLSTDDERSQTMSECR